MAAIFTRRWFRWTGCLAFAGIFVLAVLMVRLWDALLALSTIAAIYLLTAPSERSKS